MKDSQLYLQRMAKPLQEKLKVVRFFPPNAKEALDVGCADGAVTLAMAKMFPDLNFLGIDLNNEFINIANQNKEAAANVRFEKVYLRELLASPKRYDVVTFMSVLHEFFTYGEGISTVVKALADAHEILNPKGRIIVRDMILSDYAKDSSLYVENIVEKISSSTFTNQLESFESIWGKINTLYCLNHFLLKYWYLENWERESKENYVPVTFDRYQEILSLLGMKILYKESYLIPFLKDKWQKDFGLTEEELSPLRSTGILVGEK